MTPNKKLDKKQIELVDAGEAFIRKWAPPGRELEMNEELRAFSLKVASDAADSAMEMLLKSWGGSR